MPWRSAVALRLISQKASLGGYSDYMTAPDEAVVTFALQRRASHLVHDPFVGELGLDFCKHPGLESSNLSLPGLSYRSRL